MKNILAVFHQLGLALEGFIMLPAVFLLHQPWFSRRTAFWIHLLTLALLAGGWAMGVHWPSFIALFALCLSFSTLYHKIHREKKSILQGFKLKDEAVWIPLDNVRSSLLWWIHILLFISLIMLLRHVALVWGEEAFQPATQDPRDWFLYSVDLLFKAVLFDIPEVYRWNIVEIEHVGWMGSHMIFASRLIILVLIMGALFRIFEVRNLLRESVGVIDRYPEIGRARLLLFLQLFPKQIRRLCWWATGQSLGESTRCQVLEVLGETGRSATFSTLEECLSPLESTAVRRAALRGMERLNIPKPDLLHNLYFNSPHVDDELLFQAGRTLSGWKSLDSLSLLVLVARKHDKVDIRKNAIANLGRTRSRQALRPLVEIFLDREVSKEERFAAQESVLTLGVLSPTTRSQMEEILVTSEHPDQRRFAAMTLGGTKAVESFPTLAKALGDERDENTVVRIIQALGEISHHRGSARIDPQVGGKTLQDLIERCGEDHPLFVRLASIQALVDFTWLIDEDQMKGDDLTELLKELSQSDSHQIADTATNALRRLATQMEDLEFEERSDLITTVEMDDIQWRDDGPPSPPSSRPVVPSTIYPEVPPPPGPSGATFFSAASLEGECPHFTIRKSVAQGRISAVLQVHDSRDDKTKAIKICTSPQESARRCFAREQEVLSQVSHPSLPRLEEAFDLSGSPALVMDWRDEARLLDVLHEKKSQKIHWELDNFCRVYGQLIEAVSYLHQQGWGHGDIKPENILVGKDQVILLDFNCAFPLQRTGDSPQDALPAGGTAYYLAPERLFRADFDDRADIYSLGVMAYEMLTGSLPLGISPLPIQHWRNDISRRAQELMARGTSFKPSQRPSSVVEYWRDLERELTS